MGVTTSAFPIASSQLPLFNNFGTRPEHMRHAVLESGHIIPLTQTSAEIQAWLDRYLRPVK
jgi:hypothetical protein